MQGSDFLAIPDTALNRTFSKIYRGAAIIFQDRRMSTSYNCKVLITNCKVLITDHYRRYKKFIIGIDILQLKNLPTLAKLPKTFKNSLKYF